MYKGPKVALGERTPSIYTAFKGLMLLGDEDLIWPVTPVLSPGTSG